MADTTDTPTTTEADAPATPRRRGRRSSATDGPSPRRGRRKTVTETAGAAVETAETAVADTAAEVVKRTRRAAAKAEGKVGAAVKAVKPRSSSRTKPAPAAKTGSAAKKAAKSRKTLAAVGMTLLVGGTTAAALLLKGSSKPRRLPPLEKPKTDPTPKPDAVEADPATTV